MAGRTNRGVDRTVGADELLDQLASPGASTRVAYRKKMATKRYRRRRLRYVLAGLGAIVLLALGAVGYAVFGPGGDDETASPDATLASSATDVEAIRLLLQGIGYDDLDVVERDGTIVVTGAVETAADRAAVATATSSLSNGVGVDVSGLTVSGTDDAAVDEEAVAPAAPSADANGAGDPLQRLQVLLNRTVAANPVIFEQGDTDVASWHAPTLDRVVDILAANPGIAVIVVGHTDDRGASDFNRELSEERAAAVRDYLVAGGLDEGLIRSEARGEDESTGRRDVGYLERRVEFEVVAASAMPLMAQALTVGVIMPSAGDDLAFSQSMVDALAVLGEERGGLTVMASDNLADVELAEQEARRMVDEGADVVVLHGSQYRSFVEELAWTWPNVVFVVGPSEVDTELPNVFIYSMAAEQGAYVLGDLAADLSASDTIGIVGPIPVPEPQRFVEGFRLGAEARGAVVLADYVGSFNDAEAATALAEQHLAAGADVLTGTSQLTVGPVALARNEGVLWFANQANQASLAPDVVVASQVYHFEVALREILAEIDADATSGGIFPLTLGNGGMLLEFNPDYPLSDEQRQRADELLLDIAAGAVPVDVDLDQ
ncbi:MAG: BMP family ABC transporter substrate-binding protein [Actinomycetota bacterium]